MKVGVNIGDVATAREPKMADNGPSFTKATYDKKRPKKLAPSPEQKRRELEDKATEAARKREFAQQVTKFGLAHSLFPEKVPPKERIKRRT